MADDKGSDKKQKSSIKDIEVEGYKFKVDTDMLDDVEIFELIDRIENKQQIAAIVPLLEFLIGGEEYQKMKTHFTEADAKENEGKEGYKGRFRLSKLQDVYLAIIEQFDPKG